MRDKEDIVSVSLLLLFYLQESTVRDGKGRNESA